MSTAAQVPDFIPAQSAAPDFIPDAGEEQKPKSGAVSRFLTRATGLPIDDITAHPGAYIPVTSEYWKRAKGNASQPSAPDTSRGNPMIPFHQTAFDIGDKNYWGAAGDIAPGIAAAMQFIDPPMNFRMPTLRSYPEPVRATPSARFGDESAVNRAFGLPSELNVPREGTRPSDPFAQQMRLPSEVPAVESGAAPASFNGLRSAEPEPAPPINALTVGRTAPPAAMPESFNGLRAATGDATPRPRFAPGNIDFLSPEETADYGLQGGMRLPNPDEARLANSDRTLTQTGNWRRDRTLYDPLSYPTGPTPEQMQAARDFFHSPLKNWNGEPIAVRPSTTEYAPADLSQDLTPLLEESLRQVQVRRNGAPLEAEGDSEAARRGAPGLPQEELPLNQVPLEQRPSTTIPQEENERFAQRTEARNDQKPIAPQTGAQPEADNLPPGSVGEVPTAQIKQAPHRFQYKLNTDAEGVGQLLKGQTRYNPDLAGVISVWRDPADGELYVVNGHHRLELAKRTGQETVLVRHVNAKDAAQARAIGALQNIAEGRGSSIDAAKFFRDTGLSADDLQNEGISLGEATAQRGLAISRLEPSLFGKTVQGDIPEGRAVAIGEATEDHAEQKAISQLIERQEAKGRRVNNDTLRELIRFVQGAGQSEETTASLFGTESIAKSHALEKAEVSTYVKQQLHKDKKLFGFVSKGERAAELERGDNIINVKASKDIAEQATQGEEVYNKLSERSGPIADILDDAARRIASGENANAVKQEAFRDIQSELSQTLGRGQTESAQGSSRAPAGNGKPQARAKREASLSGAPEPIAEYRRSSRSLHEPSETELSSWSKSRTLRISDGGKQSSLFGTEEPMYKLTRRDTDGNQESLLITEAQFHALRKSSENFDKAARAFEQGVAYPGEQTSMFDVGKTKKQEKPSSGSLF